MPNFIQDDEYIILFDHPTRPMSRRDIALVASGGVRTALKNLEWSHIEAAPGHYDWSEYDEFVDHCVHSHVKVLLITPSSEATCMPDDWYCWSKTGSIKRDPPDVAADNYSIFSPWHNEAQAYRDAFVQLVVDRYQSSPVQVIRGGAHGGESLMPYDPFYFDPAALESFRVWASGKFYGNLSAFNKEEGSGFPSWDQVMPGVFQFGRIDHLPITKLWLRESIIRMVVHQQQQLVSQYHGEAWLMLASCWTDIMETGNFLIPDIASIIMERVQPTHINWIAYSHFNMSSTVQAMTLKRLKDESVQLWTGAQFCEGLAVNTQPAIALGLRGFVCGPLSLEGGHDKQEVEPWMVDNIRNSLAEWSAAREL